MTGLVGIQDWPGPTCAVILVPTAEHIDAVAANYPKAAVLALPIDCEEYIEPDGWICWMALFQADLTLWPIDALSAGFLAACVPIIGRGGIRTLRWAARTTDDYSRFAAVKTLWRDRRPHPGPIAVSDRAQV